MATKRPLNLSQPVQATEEINKSLFGVVLREKGAT